VRAQLLDGSRPAGLADMVRHLTLLQMLFEFDYQLEMYKPAAKRRWGYFALPILYGDRLVGKLDTTADRKAGVLRVQAIHQDVPFSSTANAAIGQDLARWLGLELALPRQGRGASVVPAQAIRIRSGISPAS
jgi:uncharacterized protein YcaQ